MKTEAKFSVVILTLNEELNLPECFDSLSACKDIVVFDSFSTDKTEKVCEEMGGRFFKRSFDNYAAQRNAAINDVTYENEWLLMLDADERINEELILEMNQFIETHGQNYSMARLRRKDFFDNKWLKRCSAYPTWFGRLIKKGEVSICREINEEYVTDGQIYHFKGHLIHFPFNKGVAWWYERHNKYSSMEAEKLIKEIKQPLQFKSLFSRDPVLRRRTLKQMAFRLPLRPFIVFVYLYFLRLGFVDGVIGFRYTLMRCSYEYMIDLKMRELKKKVDS